MGCRPSKQATSKVRAADHGEDPKCLCSPRKVRRVHKCDSSSNGSKRASGGSKSESKKQSFSSGHRPRSAKSADLDFPAFSTTTAVYRKSASKTSKITLRLSCDGSTLEIEQCDYDLEKAHGDADSRPRPWNSAPNLTRLRDSKARLFRDSYLPMKHSASAWSPSVTSTASGAHGGLIRVPVQINTPDDSLASPGNINRHDFSNASYNGSNSSRDQGSKGFGKDSRGKSDTPSQRPRVRASSGFTVSDEREPLLRGSDDGSQKLTGMENHINKACDVPLQFNRKEGLPQSNTLNNMLNDLECSLELTHHITHSSGPVSRRPQALEVNHTVTSEPLNHPKPSGCASNKDMTHSSSKERYYSDCSPDFEQIPVNVVSFVPVPPYSSGVGSGTTSNHIATLTSSDIYCPANQPLGKPWAWHQLNSGQMGVSIQNNGRSLQLLTNGHSGLKKAESTTVSHVSHQKAGLFSSVGPTKTISSRNKIVPKLHETHDSFCQFSYPSPSPSSPIDSDSILKFVTLGCPVSSEMPSFMYASGDESPLSLFTPQHHILRSPGEVYSAPFENCYSRVMAWNQMDSDTDAISQDCDLCTSNCATDVSDQESLADNATQFVIDNLQSDDAKPRGTPLISDVCMRKDIREQEQNKVVSGEHRNIEAISDRSLVLETTRMKNDEKTRRDRDMSSVNVMGGTVEENYILSQGSEQPLDERHSSVDRDIRRTSSRPINAVVLHEAEHALPSRSGKTPDGLISSPGGMARVRWKNDGERKNLTDRVVGAADVENHNGPHSRAVTNDENIAKNGNMNTDRLRCGTIMKCRQFSNCEMNLTEKDNESAHYIVSMEIQGPDEDSSHNVYYQHDVNTDSKNADYLMELLYPEGQTKSTSIQRKTRFNYDVDYIKLQEFDVSSHSDASDNEISPQCYVLIGQHKKSPDKLASARGENSACDDNHSVFTSMQNVRQLVIERNLLVLQHKLHKVDQHFTGLCKETRYCKEHGGVVGSKVTDGQYKSETNTIYCAAGPVIRYPGSVVGTNANSVSNLQGLKAPVKSGPNMEAGKTSHDNENKNKGAVMCLQADILAGNITHAAGTLGKGSSAVLLPHEKGGRRQRDGPNVTKGDVCKNHSNSVSLRSMADGDVFSGHHILSCGTGTCETVPNLRASSDISTRRQIRVDSEGGRLSIDALTSGHQRPGRNSKGQPSEYVIDSRDRIHLNLDGIPVRALTPQCQISTTHDMALENSISDSSSTSSTETGRDASVNGAISVSNGVSANQTKLPRAFSDVPEWKSSSMWANCNEYITSAGQSRGLPVLPEAESPSSIQSKRRANLFDVSHWTVSDVTLSSSVLLPTSQHDIKVAAPLPEGSSDSFQQLNSFDGLSGTLSDQSLADCGASNELVCSFSNGGGQACVMSKSLPVDYGTSSKCIDNVTSDVTSVLHNGTGLNNFGILPPIQQCEGNENGIQRKGIVSKEISFSESADPQLAGMNSTEYTKYDSCHQQLQDNNSSLTECINKGKVNSSDMNSASFYHHLPSISSIDPPLTSHSSLASDMVSIRGRSCAPSLMCLPSDSTFKSMSTQPCPGSQDLNTKLMRIDPTPSDNVSLSNFDGESEKIAETSAVPRRNVLSLVRYFEKVPHTRNEPKQ